MRIVGIGGGTPEGMTTGLLEQALVAAADEGKYLGFDIDTEIVQLHEITKSFHRGAFDFPDWVRPTFELMSDEESQGFIFATPVQQYGMTPIMKNLLDYMTSMEDDDTGFHSLIGRIFGVIVHCHEDGGMQTALAICGALDGFGMAKPGHGLFFQNENGKDRSEHRWQEKDHLLVGQNVARLALRNSDHFVEVNNWKLRR